MKLTKKQIELIVRNTPEDLRMESIGSSAGNELGYYQPSGANWAYHAVFIERNGYPLLVVTRFGHIC